MSCWLYGYLDRDGYLRDTDDGDEILIPEKTFDTWKEAHQYILENELSIILT